LHSCCSRRLCLARFHIAHLHHAFTPTSTAEAEHHCCAPPGQSATLGCRRTKATHHGHIAKSGHSSASPSHLCAVLLEHRRQAGEPEPTPPTREPRHQSAASPPRAPRIKTKTHVCRCSPSTGVRSSTDRNNSNHGEPSHPLCTTTILQCRRRSGAPRGEAEVARPLQLLVAARRSMPPEAARVEHHRSV
jgi:hypothetical protein